MPAKTVTDVKRIGDLAEFAVADDVDPGCDLPSNDFLD
jgi:hypothetical protein